MKFLGTSTSRNYPNLNSSICLLVKKKKATIISNSIPPCLCHVSVAELVSIASFGTVGTSTGGAVLRKSKWDGHYCSTQYLHSRKLTWNLKMMVSNRKLLFQVSIFGCHVSFRGCTFHRTPIFVFFGGREGGSFLFFKD